MRMLDFLNTRELAALIWAAGLVALTIVLAARSRDGSISSSFVDVLRAFFLSRLVLAFGSAAVFCGLVVYAAERVGLWHLSTLKETVYWFALSGTVITVNAIEKSPLGYGYLGETLGRAIRVTVVAE